jgi:3-deoxy-D-manno-octulosonic-acid transferase
MIRALYSSLMWLAQPFLRRKLARRGQAEPGYRVAVEERFGRYSFIGLPARTLLRASSGLTEVVTDGQVVERHEGNPLDQGCAVIVGHKIPLSWLFVALAFAAGG